AIGVSGRALPASAAQDSVMEPALCAGVLLELLGQPAASESLRCERTEGAEHGGGLGKRAEREAFPLELALDRAEERRSDTHRAELGPQRLDPDLEAKPSTHAPQRRDERRVWPHPVAPEAQLRPVARAAARGRLVQPAAGRG